MLTNGLTAGCSGGSSLPSQVTLHVRLGLDVQLYFVNVLLCEDVVLDGVFVRIFEMTQVAFFGRLGEIQFSTIPLIHC